MAKYKTLEEFRAAAKKRSLAYYHRMKQDPKKYKAYLEKRKGYSKKRYHDMIKELTEE